MQGVSQSTGPVTAGEAEALRKRKVVYDALAKQGRTLANGVLQLEFEGHVQAAVQYKVRSRLDRPRTPCQSACCCLSVWGFALVPHTE